MRGKIISCFPCCGKTYFCTNYFEQMDVIDHDMYDFRFRGGHGDKWFDFYLARMRQLIRKFDYIFVNAIPEIIEQLPSTSMVIYPHKSLKNDWVNRAKSRGGESAFPKLLEEKWDEWIKACEKWKGKSHVLAKGEYLTDCFDIFKRNNGITVN